jgi:DNA-binding NarL/FixJ family response regulator
MRLTVCTRDPLMARVVAVAADAAPSLERPRVISHRELEASAIDGVTVVDVDAVADLEYAAASRNERSGIVLLVPCDDARSVLDGLARTPAALISKPDGLLSLGSVLRDVARGHQVAIDPSVERLALQELRRRTRAAALSTKDENKISDREQQVLELVASGRSSRQIGRELHISPRTVESHIGRLYRKLAVHSRLQAVGRAAALGLIEVR